MLEIKNISKTYKTGNLIQRALNNVSLNLRNNEFVAILGPSGSGKTTLLNIIGGLDRYDSGDLIINGKSTSKYKDRDWDTYRNHTIGFVFQSYNLIPHQTILSNVELALTIGGISASKRRKMALDALDSVGLKDQAHKRPNQMSGGQMQRVAIARALVNNPDILLADEPTGALDSKTSIQVMELLKEVAKDRLVVMVTHNPDLANEYANRIVSLKDGQIINDTNPCLDVENNKKSIVKTNKAHMSYFTALSLSFNNLLTKKGRTILTAFAGSIGIIGIALILSLSQGFQNYIDKIQEDTLSSYPLTITQESTDMTSMILSMRDDAAIEQGDNTVKERQFMSNILSSVTMNNLKLFKHYLEDHYDEISNDVSNISYAYSVRPLIFTIDVTDKLVQVNPNNMLASFTSGASSSLLGGGFGVFSEMSDDIESLEENYEVLAGAWPSNYDEIIIVLSRKDTISDLLVYSLGLRDFSELSEMVSNYMANKEIEKNDTPLILSYDELMNIDLRLINATDAYKYNPDYDIYEDMSNNDEYMLDLYNRSTRLKVVGVVAPKEGSNSMALQQGVAYTKALTRHIIDTAKETPIVKKQLSNKEVDVFSGKLFSKMNEENENKLDFEKMISIDEDMLKDAFKINIDEDSFNFDNMIEIASESANKVVDGFISDTSSSSMLINSMLKMLTGYDMGVNSIAKDIITTYCEDPNNYTEQDNIRTINTTNLNTYLSNYYSQEKYTTAIATNMRFIPEQYSMILNADTIKGIITGEVNAYFADAITVDVTNINNPIYSKNIDDSITQTLNATTLTFIKNMNVMMVATEISKALKASMSPLKDLFSEDLMEIDTDKFAKAFKFDMTEEELSRIMSAMMSSSSIANAKTNLIKLGYQDLDEPTTISFYFNSFDAKENFLAFLNDYNDNAQEEDKLNYTDITGLLMGSVKTIVDSVTYVLIAFVSISLVVSSIMIAVITLISVMERTKEIGILRAMGASKHNVSSIFNAETFIIGLLSGLLGVGTTFLAIPPINVLIHNVTDNYDINAVLPMKYAIILIIISVILTIVAGIIPSKKASKQDPVIALRTE